MILSASRRTDIPAYYGDWFLSRLKAGSFFVRNPFNPKQAKEIPVSPEDVECIVFWTKNPVPLIPYLPELDKMGYIYYFQYTLTPYDATIERNLPPKRELIRAFQELSGKLGKRKMIWRYDPVLFTGSIGVREHIEFFRVLAEQLAPHTERCVISFLDFYRKTARNIMGCGIVPPDAEMIKNVSLAFRNIAESCSLHLFSCCESLERFGISAGACIDPELIADLTGKKLERKKDRSQRKNCNCASSIDVGAYNTCSNGCVYCYANTKPFPEKRME